MVSVGTCPECLPVGSITWLIENGRQLELFGEEGVLAFTRGDDPEGLPEEKKNNTDRPYRWDGLPF